MFQYHNISRGIVLFVKKDPKNKVHIVKDLIACTANDDAMIKV